MLTQPVSLMLIQCVKTVPLDMNSYVPGGATDEFIERTTLRCFRAGQFFRPLGIHARVGFAPKISYYVRLSATDVHRFYLIEATSFVVTDPRVEPDWRMIGSSTDYLLIGHPLLSDLETLLERLISDDPEAVAELIGATAV